MPSDIPVVFMGSDPISLPLLEGLYAYGAVKLVGVFTQPDRPKGRGQALQANPIKEWAIRKGIAVLQPERVGEEEVAWFKEKGVQLAFVMAYGQLLKQPVLDAFALGAWNFHASILPAYRGACPIEASIWKGDKETGVCLMQMVLKMDAGAVVDCEKVVIDSKTTTPLLRERLSKACIPLLERQLGALLEGRPQLTPQDESQKSYVRKLSKEDGWLDFELPATELERQWRAFNPWPGAFFEHGSIILKVGKVEAVEGKGRAPGEVVFIDGRGVGVATGEGVLLIKELQKPGGKMMEVGAFLRGYSLGIGEVVRGQKAMYPLITPEYQKLPKKVS